MAAQLQYRHPADRKVSPCRRGPLDGKHSREMVGEERPSGSKNRASGPGVQQGAAREKLARHAELDRLDSLYVELFGVKEDCYEEKSGERVLNDTLCHFKFTTEISKRYMELLPKV